MRYNVLTFVTNTQNQYAAAVNSTYPDNLKGAKFKYHQLLANFQNASDVLVAAVKIVDEYGNPLSGYDEIVDNTPEPEPEPEPQPEPEEPTEPEGE